jgi:hypothetical protein
VYITFRMLMLRVLHICSIFGFLRRIIFYVLATCQMCLLSHGIYELLNVSTSALDNPGKHQLV